MANKVTKKTRSGAVGYAHYVIPSVIGGVIAWYFADSMGLGILVFSAVLVGNYFGFKILQKNN